MSAELKPCPFCGAKEHESTGTGGPELRIDEKGCHFVFCFGCGATGPQHAFFQTEAIPAWNRRAADGVEACNCTHPDDPRLEHGKSACYIKSSPAGVALGGGGKQE